jgi:putative adenylate-forming enzyme
VHAARAFARTRWLQMRLRSRADVERHQNAGLTRLARDLQAHIPFYQGLDGPGAWPVVDKAALLADFPRFNRAGIAVEEIRAALAAGTDHVRGHSVGQSTGTSGNRGFYVVSDAERFVWLGTLLAKALPDALWRRHRVALALPGLSSLYRSANSGSRIALGFFDLADGVEAWADDLARFDPDTIVAPPKVLRRLAERGQLRATTIFSGAEVLDPADRALIEAATGRRVREIYMATEGLFGVGCRFGTLHLAEDVVRFEWEAVAGSGLRIPIVTDFTRRAQAMVRYRMNDLIALEDRPCPCGSPLQAVRQIEGRSDDLFELAGADGRARMVTPDVLRNAVLDADPRITDYRLVQTGPGTIEVHLAEALGGSADAAVRAALERLVARLGAAPVAVEVKSGIAVPFDRKLRRVIRDWQP